MRWPCSNIHYEIADRTRAIAPGGIGAIHLLARKLGLVEDIDRDLHLLKRHQPYFESDHVLNIAYNLLAGGQRLEHLEVRRNDEVYLDALGAERIPDPTTAGDFCRRFGEADVERLMDTFNEARLRAWKQQPDAFFDEAFIDADGALAPSDAWCKQGVDIGVLVRGPIAAAVEQEQRLGGVGQRDHQRVVAPLPLVRDIHPLFAPAVTGASVPSASMNASSKKASGCSFQARSRVSLKMAINCSTSPSVKRRQKSPAVVGSGMRCAPRASR